MSVVDAGHLGLADPLSKDLETADNGFSFPFSGPENGELLTGYGSTNLFEFQDFHENVFATSPKPFDFFAGPAQEKRFEDPIAIAIKDLGKLSLALYDFAAKLPSKPTASSGTGSTDSAWTAFGGSSPRQKRLLVLDEIFSLTTGFVNIVGALSQHEHDVVGLSQNTPVSSTRELIFSAIPEQQIARTDPGIRAKNSKSPLSHLDEATMLMVMSCHCRLIDIYLSIFQMMQVCMEYSFPPGVEDNWTVVLPRLQVGSHAAPLMQVDAKTPLSRSTTSMYMLMITMLSSQLCEKVAGVMGVRGDRDSGSTPSQRREASEMSEFDVLKARVRDRTERLERTIGTTQGLLQRFSVVG